LIAEKRIAAAVPLVAAALGDDVDGRAGGKSELGGEGAAVHLELLNGFHADVGSAKLSRAIVILAAIERHQVVPPVATAYRESGSNESRIAGELGARRVGTGDPWQSEDRFGEVARNVGQIPDLNTPERIRLLSFFGFNQRNCFGDDDFTFHGADLKMNVEDGGLTDGQLHALRHGLVKSFGAHLDAIEPRRKERNLIGAIVTGGNCLRGSTIKAGDHDGRSRDDRRVRIVNGALEGCRRNVDLSVDRAE